MYADEPRVGVLTIPDEIVASEELRVLLDPAPAMYQHRVGFEEHDTAANRVAAIDAMREGVQILLRTRPDLIVYACTSGGVFAGPAWHRELLDEMHELCGEVPFYTAAEAVTQTLAAAGLRKVSVATPYSEDTIGGLVDVLEESGVAVLTQAMLFADGYPDPWTVMSTPPEAVAELALRADHPDADAVFVSCTGLASTPILAPTEARLGKPLLTSNVALAKVIRDVLGCGPVTGFGSILAGRGWPPVSSQS